MSRKQLPIVDVNGSVKYSTPSGDVEMNWLEKGSGTPSPQSASLGNYNNRNNQLRSNSAALIPSTGKLGFSTSPDTRLIGGDRRKSQSSNSRNCFSDVDQNQQEQRSSTENEPDWSQISSRVSFTLKMLHYIIFIKTNKYYCYLKFFFCQFFVRNFYCVINIFNGFIKYFANIKKKEISNLMIIKTVDVIKQKKKT